MRFAKMSWRGPARTRLHEQSLAVTIGVATTPDPASWGVVLRGVHALSGSPGLPRPSRGDLGWQPLLLSADRKEALAALKAGVVMSVRRGLKGGKIWLAHSRAHRDREEQLIPQAEWLQRRSSIVSSMSLAVA